MVSSDCAQIAAEAVMAMVPLAGTTVVVVSINTTLAGVAPLSSVFGVAEVHPSDVEGATVYAVNDSGTSSAVETQATPTTVSATCCAARLEVSVYVVASAAIDAVTVIVSTNATDAALAVCAAPETATAIAASVAKIAASNVHVITSLATKAVVCVSERTASVTGLPPTRELGTSNGAVPCITV